MILAAVKWWCAVRGQGDYAGAIRFATDAHSARFTGRRGTAMQPACPVGYGDYAQGLEGITRPAWQARRLKPAICRFLNGRQKPDRKVD